MEQANSRGRFKLQQALASEECSGAPVFPPLSDHGEVVVMVICMVCEEGLVMGDGLLFW